MSIHKTLHNVGLTPKVTPCDSSPEGSFHLITYYDKDRAVIRGSTLASATLVQDRETPYIATKHETAEGQEQ